MNWVGTSRSNRFRVKDLEAFKKFCIEHELEILEGDGDDGVAITAKTDSGDWPNEIDTDDDDWASFRTLLTKHLVDGEVAILMTIGAEGLRYLTGYAVAITPGKEECVVDLTDIYDIAERLFGITPTKAEY